MQLYSVTPLDAARTYLGLEEVPGPSHNPLVVGMLQYVAMRSEGYGGWHPIDDETAWCGAFAGFVCHSQGILLPKLALRARSWLSVGLDFPLDLASQPGPWEGWLLAIFARGNHPNLDPSVVDAPGHVTFVSHYDPSTGLVHCIGGNQSNKVSLASYGTSALLGLRLVWPGVAP